MSLQVNDLPRNDADEREVLAGLMRSDVLPGYLIAKGVTAGDLWHHTHRVAWGVLWDLIGSGITPHPADVWLVLRASGLAVEFGGKRAAAMWVADTWCVYRSASSSARAAERVLWLAERRAAIHAANELIRDATDGHIRPTDPRLGLVAGKRRAARAI